MRTGWKRVLVSATIVVAYAFITVVSLPATAQAASTGPSTNGYWLASTNGGIFSYGKAPFYGSMGGTHLNKPIVGIASTATGQGYWEVASDGGLFSFGKAQFHGSMGGKPLNKPIVGMAVDPATGGYWEVASDGGIFAFDAPFYGSMGGKPLNKPVVAIAATATGGGYWEVASDGGIFSFGNAQFHGSMGGKPLNQPIVGMSTDYATGGYWEVASDGGIFSFDAPFHGSMGGQALTAPIVNIIPTSSGTGYWMVGSNGRVYSFGDAPTYGADGLTPASVIVGMSTSDTPVVPVAPPSAPTIQSVDTEGGGQVQVSWTAPSTNGGSTITGYIVTPYIGASAQASIKVSADSTSTVVSGLLEGDTYTFSVAAVNAAGVGAASAMSAHVVLPTVPLAPTNVQVVAGKASATVSWTPPASDGGSALTGYVITPYVSGVAGTTVSVSAGSASATVPGLTGGDTYTFSVAAVNAAGVGAASAMSASVVLPTVPSSPVNVQVVAGKASATVSWTPPSSDGGSVITGYVITPYASGAAETAISVSAGSASAVVTGLIDGDTYTFVVAAVNGLGDSVPSAMSTSVVPATVPASPVNVRAVAGNASATVYWTSPASDGGSVITGYVVTPYLGNVAQSGVVVGEATRKSVVSGLQNGVQYSVQVHAVNGVGNGASGVSGLVTPSTVPAAPTGVSASVVGGNIQLTWTAPTNGGLAISSYVVTPSTNGDIQGSAMSTGSSVTSFVVPGLTVGVSYTFEVAAVNADGMGAVSQHSQGATILTVPGAPSIGTVKASGATISVTWTAPANDGGATISGYRLVPYISGVAQAAVTVGDILSDTISALQLGDVYSFRVAAINAQGIGGFSGTSATVVPTTVPGAATGVTAKITDSQIVVSWQAPADTGGLSIAQYTVTPYVGGVAGLSVTVDSTSAVFSHLTEGITYVFSVVANNADGNGAVSVASAGIVIPLVSTGYWIAGSDGSIKPFGNAAYGGSMGGASLNEPVVGMAALPTSKGYWLVASTGGVFAFGTAQFYGSMGGQTLNEPVVGMAATPTYKGYWLVAATGGIFAFGAAQFHGSMGGKTLNKPVVGMAADPATGGYWLVAATGGIFAFDVPFLGTPMTINPALPSGGSNSESVTAPIVGMAATNTGGGYWLVGSNGAIYAFGNAGYYNSLPGEGFTSNGPIKGMVPTAGDNGYWLVGSTGGVFSFGDAHFYGSASGKFSSGITAVAIAQTTSLTTVTAVTVPKAPTNAAASGGNGQASVAWSAPSTDGGVSLDGYQITPFLGGVAQSPIKFSSTNTEQTISNLTSLGNYTFEVAAINGVGVGAESNMTNAVTTETASGRPSPGSSGYDISNYQCGGYPPSAAIGIVQVQGALGGADNPCLAGEAAWAGKGLGLYIFMDGGATSNVPNACSGNTSCAFGYNGAQSAYAYATSEGVNTHVIWWLDVESGSSWSGNAASNQAVIQGSIDYLQAQGVTVGVYTGNYSWNGIVGSWQPDIPEWVADYAIATGAQACADESTWAAQAGAALPTGGLWMMQYTDVAAGAFDGDYAC